MVEDQTLVEHQDRKNLSEMSRRSLAGSNVRHLRQRSNLRRALYHWWSHRAAAILNRKRP